MDRKRIYLSSPTMHGDGDFDGNNYKISALTISSASADSGLFGVLRKSNINNLTVEGDITGNSQGNSQRLGGYNCLLLVIYLMNECSDLCAFTISLFRAKHL